MINSRMSPAEFHQVQAFNSHLYRAGVVGAAGVAALTYVLNKSQQGSSQGSAQSPRRMSSPGKIRRKNAVVVFGASGKMGQKLVRQVCSSMTLGVKLDYYLTIPQLGIYC